MAIILTCQGYGPAWPARWWQLHSLTELNHISGSSAGDEAAAGGGYAARHIPRPSQDLQSNTPVLHVPEGGRRGAPPSAGEQVATPAAGKESMSSTIHL